MILGEKHKAILDDAHGDADAGAIALCFALLSTAEAIDKDCAARLRPHGLSEGKFILLSLLRRAPGGLPPHELAARAGVTRATITGLIDGLERDALLRRAPDEKDRRMIRVTLTPKGATLAAELSGTHTRWIASLTSGLNDDERALLTALLRKIWAQTDAGRGLSKGTDT